MPLYGLAATVAITFALLAGCGDGGSSQTGASAEPDDAADPGPSAPTVADVRTCLEDGGIKPKVADSGIYIPDDDAIPRMDYSVLSIGTFDGSTLPDSVQVFEGSQADAEAAAAEVAARSAANQAGLEALGLPGAEIPEGQVQGALGATVVFVDESTPATDKATVLECAHG